MDFEYLLQEFSNDLLDMDSFKTFSEDKLLDNCEFFSYLKDESLLVKKTICMLLMLGICLIFIIFI